VNSLSTAEETAWLIHPGSISPALKKAMLSVDSGPTPPAPRRQP